MKKLKCFSAAILIMAMATFGGCKKESSTTPSPAPTAPTSYAVKYTFTSSDASHSDFSMTYTDETGKTQQNNAAYSGWTYSFVGHSGQYVSISGQGFHFNASVLVSIYYNNQILSTQYASASSSSISSATAAGTLP